MERVRLDCGTEKNHRDVTVFANGTLRIRQGQRGQERLELRELGPAVADRLFADLAALDRSQSSSDEIASAGQWLELCELDLVLPDQEVEHWEYSSLTRLELGLSETVRRIEALRRWVEDPKARPGGLDSVYEPQQGDVLERADGSLWKLRGFTADRLAAEFEGVDNPLVIYVPAESIPFIFVDLIERKSP